MSGRGPVRRALRALTRAGSAAAVVLTAHSLLNARSLRTPSVEPAPVDGRVSVLLPVRDEEERVGACLVALLDQVGVPDCEVLVLDDASTDRTAEVVAAVGGTDPRVRLLRGDGPPDGWLGKPHACATLAAAATGEVLVFVDADVVLAPHALAAGVELLRTAGLDLLCPYPRQLALTWSERLVQPLLQWSWLTTLPLRAAETSPRPSLSAANGQFLLVDAAAYRRAGGHGAVRAAVLDDVGLLRAVKAAGGRGGVADGTELATCRMYDGWPALREGYAKSLWSAFGSVPAAAAVAAGLAVVYVLPPLAALAGSRAGAAGYVAAVVGRYAAAERTGGRSLPDSLGHPASVVLLIGLLADSWWRHRHGGLSWKGRALP
ncbi:glycosyltransferase family 2 protein [Paenibacillus sp. TRM 82003]|uniref:glycosyltransferase n=1 Tax=Kineococcus sp. TRM81007 TaxID=2925831 RepID=UPI001F57006A|nr:glycosyltransferase family 2 protein [Kineococcus sp. TRM81007]MCI2239681.1 glycosyltransferase family 2 protein [Kineococcus sp. TRM81007]MCI3926756.1 glycosyltransferase family 2 protein [Paenibacillus sp. TRM 82003]